MLRHGVGHSLYYGGSENATSLLCFAAAAAAAAVQVIKETSALTFMIAGTVKEVVTVITAVLVFGDKFGLVNGIGLVIVIGGVLLFNWYKLHKLQQQVRQRIHSKDASLDVDLEVDGEELPGNGSSSSPRVGHEAAGVRGLRVLQADGSSGSRSISPSVAELGGSKAGGAHSFTKLRKGGVGAAAAAGDEDLSPEEAMQLEFEPLLPINGVMVRR
jgi:hypothetical protein